MLSQTYITNTSGKNVFLKFFNQTTTTGEKTTQYCNTWTSVRGGCCRFRTRLIHSKIILLTTKPAHSVGRRISSSILTQRNWVFSMRLYCRARKQFLAHQIEKSYVLPHVRNSYLILVISPRSTLRSSVLFKHWLYRTSRNFVSKRLRHNDVKTFSFKMADAAILAFF